MRLQRSITIFFLLCSTQLGAQQILKTYVGRPPAIGPATEISLNYANSLAVDRSGNLFIAGRDNGTVYKVDPLGQATIVAGIGYIFQTSSTQRVPVPALSVGLGTPLSLAVNSNGDLFIGDAYSAQIYKVSGGTIVTIAGRGPGSAGDGGPAINASFEWLLALAIGANDDLFIGDQCRIRKITGTTISTIAGTGVCGVTGENGPAWAAQLGLVNALAVDASGDIFLSDDRSHQVHQISGGIISLFAGNGVYGFTGDGGPALNAQLAPFSLAVDGSGTVYIGDQRHHTVRKVTNGIISAFSNAYSPSLAVDNTGQLYVGDVVGGVVRRFANGTSSIVAGNGEANFNGDGMLPTNTLLSSPKGLATDSKGNLYIADSQNHRIRKVTPGGIVTSLAGRPGDPVPQSPGLLAIDKADNLYVCASYGFQILKFSNESFTVFAGTDTPVSLGDFGPAVNASIAETMAIAAGESGVLYIADIKGRIRKVSGDLISTVVGYSGSSSYPICASGPAGGTLGLITGLAVNAVGELYMSNDGGCIQKLSADAITVTASTIGPVSGVAVDPAGNVYVTSLGFVDRIIGNQIVRVAGSGLYGLQGDGGPALSASLSAEAIAIDKDGNIFVAEPSLDRVRVIPTVTAPVAVTINTSPVGLSFSVDGNIYSSAQTFSWFPASLHTLSAISPNMGGPGYIYVFNGWSDGGARSHPVTPASPANYIASFTRQQSTLAISRNALKFGINGLFVTSPQVIRVNISAGSPWTATSNQNNIAVSPASGTGPGSFTVTGMPGPNGIITVSAVGAAASPQQISVTFASSATAIAPFGIFDTPTDQATVAGPIPVTGWALDNVEVSKVSIWRDPVQGETPTGNGLIYIGDAVFVDDARPDVAAAFPAYPLNYRGGWGLQVLTNVLPNANGSIGSGNGVYKLHAIAENRQGFVVEIGKKTITVANAAATKPFGTIDTPAQGGLASGASYVNFGWALTPPPAYIVITGSTIDVYVDGQNLGHPSYGQYRSDIAAAFPGYQNSSEAVGFFRFDTTAMSNGVHSIGWTVTDSGGHVEGLGSRLFNVFNDGIPPSSNLTPIGTLGTAVTYRTGFARDAAARTFHENETIEIEQVGRLELHLGAGITADRLPIGSKLDAVTGTFYWQPHASFLGKHELRFTRHLADGSQEAFYVHVQIGRTKE